jgi:hypothetical protein
MQLTSHSLELLHCYYHCKTTPVANTACYHLKTETKGIFAPLLTYTLHKALNTEWNVTKPSRNLDIHHTSLFRGNALYKALQSILLELAM